MCDEQVCKECLGNERYFREQIEIKKSSNICTYCNKSAWTLEFSIVADRVMKIFDYWLETSEEIPFDSENGFPVTDTDPTHEVIYELFSGNCNKKLIEDLIRSTGEFEFWGDKFWLGDSPLAIVRNGWSEFQRAIKVHPSLPEKLPDLEIDEHEAHFTLDLPSFMEYIEEAVRNIEGLATHMSTNCEIWRCVVYDSVRHGKDWMGSPPADKAREGRMNPIGTRYFYGATSQTTALQEAVNDTTTGIVHLSRWNPSKPLKFIRFKHSHELFFPSVFHLEDYPRRDALVFWDSFITDAMQPLKGDEDKREYWPTQFISRQFQRHFHDFDGVLYNSTTQKNPDVLEKYHQCIALFPWKDKPNQPPEDGRLDFEDSAAVYEVCKGKRIRDFE